MWSKTSAGAGGRTKFVRPGLAEGTVKEYRYPAASKAMGKPAPRIMPGSVGARPEAWQRSPEWADRDGPALHSDGEPGGDGASPIVRPGTGRRENGS